MSRPPRAQQKPTRRCAVRVARKSGAERRLSIKACWPFRRRGEFGIVTTSNRLPSGRAWSAGDDRRMPTTCALHNHRHSAAKVSDEFTVPLCRGHHREVHRCGDEAAWWKKAGIDPSAAARMLWLETHPLPKVSDKVGVESVASTAAVGSEQSGGKRDQTVSKRRPNF